MIANPLIFGILNITDDSFSDGGRYLNRDGAVSQAEYLHKEGAAVIEIRIQLRSLQKSRFSVFRQCGAL